MIIKDYLLGNTTARYVINAENRCSLYLLPHGTEKDFKINGDDLTDKSNLLSNLVQFKLSKDGNGRFVHSHKNSQSERTLFYENQFIEKSFKGDKTTAIITILRSTDGYAIKHFLTHTEGLNAFKIRCEFINDTDKPLSLDYITTVSLDGLSPYDSESNPETTFVHYFKSAWALEGKHYRKNLIDLLLESAWGDSFDGIKIGTTGSRSTNGYYPYVAVEDEKTKVFWGAMLCCNSSWQGEVLRTSKKISLSVELADYDFGHFRKTVNPKESFLTPIAYVAATKGDFETLCAALMKAKENDIAYLSEERNALNDVTQGKNNEQDVDKLPVIFNEFVTTWGNPSHENSIKIAKKLREIGSKTKYFVTDAGWDEKHLPGDYDTFNKAAFPHGLKVYADELKALGFIPGIWMEIEVTKENSKYFGKKYDDLKLKKDNAVIISEIIGGGKYNFWDFTNEKAIEHLDEVVIKTIKDNGFGYLKVDYNTNVGIGADGGDSLGEKLYSHLSAVKDYFVKIRKETGAIIENCASGGSRLEPSMMNLTEMSSATDAHEVYEEAIIGANLQYLIPARQSQLWCSLHPEYLPEKTRYIISIGFLGRICWAGDMLNLTNEQYSQMIKAENFYKKATDIILSGISYVYRSDEKLAFSNPEGAQITVRYSNDLSCALVVCHTFKNFKDFSVKLKGNYKITSALFCLNENASENYLNAETTNDEFIIKNCKDFDGNVFLIEKIQF